MSSIALAPRPTSRWSTSSRLTSGQGGGNAAEIQVAEIQGVIARGHPGDEGADPAGRRAAGAGA